MKKVRMDKVVLIAMFILVGIAVYCAFEDQFAALAEWILGIFVPEGDMEVFFAEAVERPDFTV